MIEVYPLSGKSLRSIEDTGYLNVWEGAVRSAKTVSSSIAWLKYIAESDEKTFIMSGKTLSTLYRNVIGGEFGMLALLGKKQAVYRQTAEGSHALMVQTPKGEKVCYCFGANDSSAYATLRGLTAGGWYADEVNLHNREFIDEAFRRTIVSSDRKNFWTLNPDNPLHFIYTEYIDKYEQSKLRGFHLWHFDLIDNPAITKEREEELKLQYSGVFYDRYILGKRVMSQGLIYDMFNPAINVAEKPKGKLLYQEVCADYGTGNPTVFLLLDFMDNGRVYVSKEYYWDSKLKQKQKTDSDYSKDFADFVSGVNPQKVYIDPSAASFILQLKRDGFQNVRLANNAVMDGIRNVSRLFGSGLLYLIQGACPNTEKELMAYAWDPKASEHGEDRPIKDNDHCMDALRYGLVDYGVRMNLGVVDLKIQ